MTNEDYIKKYPIGIRIRFINPRLDTGKSGTVVAYRDNGTKPVVFLPTADKHVINNYYPTLPGLIKFTWKCSWGEIEPLAQKGEQLLFSFMEQEDG